MVPTLLAQVLETEAAANRLWQSPCLERVVADVAEAIRSHGVRYLRPVSMDGAVLAGAILASCPSLAERWTAGAVGKTALLDGLTSSPVAVVAAQRQFGLSKPTCILVKAASFWAGDVSSIDLVALEHPLTEHLQAVAG